MFVDGSCLSLCTCTWTHLSRPVHFTRTWSSTALLRHYFTKRSAEKHLHSWLLILQLSISLMMMSQVGGGQWHCTVCMCDHCAIERTNINFHPAISVIRPICITMPLSSGAVHPNSSGARKCSLPRIRETKLISL